MTEKKLSVQNSAPEPAAINTTETADAEMSAVMKTLDEKAAAKKLKGNLIFFLVILFIFSAVFFVRLVVAPVSVVGSSMSPTYASGQMLLSFNVSFVDDLQYGDVICFKNAKTEGQLYIKRLEGKPGDTLVIKDGMLYRNGQLVEENYPKMDNAGILTEELTLGENEYFAMGDNRNYSKDCRNIGPVVYEDINYVVVQNKKGDKN